MTLEPDNQKQRQDAHAHEAMATFGTLALGVAGAALMGWVVATHQTRGAMERQAERQKVEKQVNDFEPANAHEAAVKAVALRKLQWERDNSPGLAEQPGGAQQQHDDRDDER